MSLLVADSEFVGIKLPMSYEEFLAWYPEEHHYEWVGGYPQRMSPVGFTHQQIVIFLAELINGYSKPKNLGVLVLGPYQMRLRTVSRGREPDLSFVTTANMHRIKDTYVDGPVDLAIEVVSPYTASVDRRDKFTEYEAEGVREYWIVDPTRRSTDFFVLNASGKYDSFTVDDESEYNCAVIPGLSVRPEWFRQVNLPDVRTIVDELNAR